MVPLPVKASSPWSAEELTAYLKNARHPLRLGVIAKQAPLIVPLWYMLDDGILWCASKRTSLVARAIGSGAACGFDVSDNTIPYRGIRGQGRVTLVDEGERVLQALVDRYLPTPESEFARWLLSGASAEVAIQITPTWVTAWDFSGRMRNLEEGKRIP